MKSKGSSSLQRCTNRHLRPVPDFRSPDTGLYSNLARLNLPYAEAVFDISYFRDHPEPFYVLAKELYPGKFHPTISHVFIALLAQKGLLQMLFTQNIDCLERQAGVPSDRIIEAHGSFATQRCIECKTEFPDDKMKEHVFRGEVPRCETEECNGLVKPDIVFFGEALPKAFDNNAWQMSTADLTLVIGTSLSVYPFAGLPEMVTDGKPRVLFNMEQVGQLGHRADDVIELGSCDEGIRKLADELGWRGELERLWRIVVGDEEADRQLKSQGQDPTKFVEDEVEKLTREVDAALKLDDDNDHQKRETNAARIAKLMDNALGPKLVEKLNTSNDASEEVEKPGSSKANEGTADGEPKEEESGAKTTTFASPNPAPEALESHGKNVQVEESVSTASKDKVTEESREENVSAKEDIKTT